jgi:hypothetical protein
VFALPGFGRPEPPLRTLEGIALRLVQGHGVQVEPNAFGRVDFREPREHADERMITLIWESLLRRSEEIRRARAEKARAWEGRAP